MNKKRIVFIFILFLITLFSIFTYKIIEYNNSDKMNNRGILKIKYKVYTKENGWLNWTNSGRIAGNLKNDITNIKIDTLRSDEFVYSYYSDDKWSEVYSTDEKIDINKKIYGIKMNLYFNEEIKYDICYRTYNKKNKWLNWTCNDNVSGNKGEAIKGIQIKIVPKYIILNEYLDSYKNNEKYNYGF